MAAPNDRPQNGNGNGNGNNGTWKWVVSGLAAALMAFAFYVLNINWNIATQYSSKQDAASHQHEDERRFSMVKENLEKQLTDATVKFRVHDQEIRTLFDNYAAMQARMLLLEGRQNDVRDALAELRSGQATIGQTLIELKQLMNTHLREERATKKSYFIIPSMPTDERPVKIDGAEIIDIKLHPPPPKILPLEYAGTR